MYSYNNEWWVSVLNITTITTAYVSKYVIVPTRNKKGRGVTAGNAGISLSPCRIIIST